ncbi:hypothetical protein ACHAXM_006161 [Skeletonema potamos]|jgi:hypothetical protein
MNDTPASIPRPKAKKNKIRPKLKPIVSLNEEDDEGLGYGEWAPSPLKPREITENDWSSGDDEKKEEILSSHEAFVGQDVKKIQPKLQPVFSDKVAETKEEIRTESRLEVTRSRPESHCSFDNKLQLSESNMDDEKVYSSDNKASTHHIQYSANSNIDNISDETIRWLRGKVWKALILMLCIAITCEVLSIVVITKVLLSHAELPSEVNETWVSDNAPIVATMGETGASEVFSSSKESNEEVPNMELTEIELDEEEAELTIESMLLSEEKNMPVTAIVTDEQYDAKDEESESEVKELPEIMNKFEEVNEGMSQLEEVHEVLENDDDKPNANDEETEIGVNEETSDSSQLEAEDYFSRSDEKSESETVQIVLVTSDEAIDLNTILDLEGLESESDDNELTDIDLLDVAVEHSDHGNQPELVIAPSEEATEKYEIESTTVEEDEQPVTNDNTDLLTTSTAEAVENEHAIIKLFEMETTSEDGSVQHEPEGSLLLDDSSHNDNNYYHEESEPKLYQESPRTTEAKREFLAKLDEFEHTFESFEVIDALIGHVVCAVPKILLKQILGVAMKVKGRFSKK